MQLKRHRRNSPAFLSWGWLLEWGWLICSNRLALSDIAGTLPTWDWCCTSTVELLLSLYLQTAFLSFGKYVDELSAWSFQAQSPFHPNHSARKTCCYKIAKCFFHLFPTTLWLQNAFVPSLRKSKKKSLSSLSDPISRSLSSSTAAADRFKLLFCCGWSSPRSFLTTISCFSFFSGALRKSCFCSGWANAAGLYWCVRLGIELDFCGVLGFWNASNFRLSLVFGGVSGVPSMPFLPCKALALAEANISGSSSSCRPKDLNNFCHFSSMECFIHSWLTSLEP